MASPSCFHQENRGTMPAVSVCGTPAHKVQSLYAPNTERGGSISPQPPPFPRESHWVACTLKLFVGTSGALREVVTLTASIQIRSVCLVGWRRLLRWSYHRFGQWWRYQELVEMRSCHHGGFQHQIRLRLSDFLFNRSAVYFSSGKREAFFRKHQTRRITSYVMFIKVFP